MTNPPTGSGAGSGITHAAHTDVRVGGIAMQSNLFLAPLSGITDVPFRSLVRRFGTRVVYSEMVASGELVKGDPESRLRAMAAGNGLHAVQLAGREPSAMRQAARQLADEGVDIIDINMGCPAKKVVGGLSGSALMRDVDLALAIIEATLEGASGVPVTVKMRLGWDNKSLNAPLIARRAEAAGVSMLTVHGRTREQFYEGKADWAAIGRVKAAVTIPLIANGDLVERHRHGEMLRLSGADGVMVGRGACGRPWLPALIEGKTDMAALERMSFADLVTDHYQSMVAHYGAAVGVRHARKHLNWYLEGFARLSGSDLTMDRSELLRSAAPSDVERRLSKLLGHISIAEVEAANEPERLAA